MRRSSMRRKRWPWSNKIRSKRRKHRPRLLNKWLINFKKSLTSARNTYSS
jgi:hypothetical protein